MLQNLLLQVDKAILAIRHRDSEEGQALVEYALILFLVSVVAVGTLTLLGQSVNSVLTKINDDL
jgi:Flp pilus assembly pilin Flp